MDLTPVYVGAGVVLNWLILWVWKPWAAAYSGEKAKNFARKEDLDIILAEVRAVTASQEEIKVRLSAEQWDRQMLMTEKKNVYGNLLLTIHEMTGSCNNMTTMIEIKEAGELSAEQEAKLTEKFYNALKEYLSFERELIRLNGLAAIFVNQQCFAHVNHFLCTPRGGLFTSLVGLKLLLKNLIDINSRVIEFAKVDFGISKKSA